MVLTDVRIGSTGKPCKLFDYNGLYYTHVHCSGLTAYGDPCKRFANGRLDGLPVCTTHFKPIKPKKRPRNVIDLNVCEEVECPVCMEDFIATESSLCGHKVCSTCCQHMKESGRTLTCPLCRDVRFKAFVDLKCV